MEETNPNHPSLSIEQNKEVEQRIDGIIRTIRDISDSYGNTTITYGKWSIEYHHTRTIPAGSFGAIWETSHFHVAEEIVNRVKKLHSVINKKAYSVSAGGFNEPKNVILVYTH